MLIIDARECWRSKSLIFVLLAACGETAIVRSEQEPGARPAALGYPIMRAIHDADDRLPREFTVVFEMRIPAVWFDPGQGTRINRCTFTSHAGVQGLTIQSEFSADPTYRHPGTPGYEPMDFDQDSNLIVWRSLGKKALSTPDVNRVYDVQQLTRISPDGKVLEGISRTQMYEYPLGSTDSIYEVIQLQLATGRGFSRHLDAFKSEKAREDGMLQLVAAGTFGRPGLVGEWELVLDPNAVHIVREAALRVENLERPALRVAARGSPIVRDGFSLAPNGTLYFARKDKDYRIEVSLIDYRPANPDLGHLRNLRELLAAPIHDGIEVIDYTGPEPRRYVAGARDGE